MSGQTQADARRRWSRYERERLLGNGINGSRISGSSMSRPRYLALYTVVFTIFALGVFFLFLKKGKSLIWNQDGGPQYYPYLVYMGRWLRDGFSRALQGDLTFKMMDFTIGFGSDVGSVARSHPLELLSGLVPTAYTEALYNAIIILRLYLAGLAFSLCASLFAPLSVHMVTGSMIYVFSGFVIALGTRHPIYAASMIMLPLLLAGAERIIRGEGWALFPAAVLLGFISNYYFMYQATAALGVYILLRLGDLLLQGRKEPYISENRYTGKAALLAILKLGVLYLLGMAMAMFALLPVVASLGSSARLSSQSAPQNLLYYEGWRHYYRWFLNLIEPVRSQEGAINLNYAVTILPALGLLLAAPLRKHRVLKLSALLGLVVILSPFCSYVLSGFSALTGRWVFICGFILAMAFAVFGEELAHLSRRQGIWIGALIALYLALGIYDWIVKHSVYLLWAMGSVVVCAILLILVNRVKGFQKAAPWLFLGLTLVSCSANSFFFYSGRFGNALEEYLDRGQALAQVEDSEFTKLAAIKAAEQDKTMDADGHTGEDMGEETGGYIDADADDQTASGAFWRAESDLVTSNKENYALLLGYYPTSVYNSVLSGPTTYYMLETDDSDLAAIHRIQGLDARAASDALANVRYYLTTYDGDAHAPYGFVRSETLSDENNAIFENQYPLAFGYTYDTYIKESELTGLNGLEKEQVMLAAAVVSDEDADKIKAAEIGAEEFAGEGLTETQLTLPDTGYNATRTKAGYKVGKGGGKISFSIQRRAGCDAYVKLGDFWIDKVSTFAYVQTGDLRTQFSMRGPDYIYSLNRKDYYIRLGYDDADRQDTLTLEFSDKGRYHLGEVSILYVPMEGFAEKIAVRNEESLTDVRFGVNTVSGKASISGEKLMAFSIPYSAGWSVYVDGEKREALQVNVGWLGVCLEAGEHEISLRYATPGAIPGRMISLAGCLLYLGLCLGGLVKERKTAGRVSNIYSYKEELKKR